MARLRAAIQKNPVLVTNTLEEAFEYVDSGGYIFSTPENSYAMFVSTEKCNYFYSIDGEHSYTCLI